MADSGFSLGKILSWLKGFLNSMSSPLDRYGFGMDDVKVNSKGDVFSALFSFKANDTTLKDNAGNKVTDVAGNELSLDVLLMALNAKEVFNPILTALNNLNSNNANNAPVLNILLGEDREDNEYHQNNGKGLLGYDMGNFDGINSDTGVSWGGKNWSWRNIASEYLRYGLECEAPGKDYGAIENVGLDECGKLIAEYLEKQNVVTTAKEVDEIDPYPFAKPVMANIQVWLAKYYTAAYSKNVEGKEKEDIDKDLEKVDQQQQQNNQEGQSDQNQGDQQGQQTQQQQGAPQNMNTSKHISVKLRKIHGSTDFDVLGLQSNYSPAETLNDLDDIISQDEFIKALPEKTQTYSIEVDDDGYDITQCEDCQIDPCESLGQILKSGITMYRNLYILHWMAKGNDMMKLHLLSEEMYEELIKEIDTLGELMVEKCGTIPQPDWCCNYLQVKPYEFQESLTIIVEYIQDYLNTIDYAYPNQTSDVQSTFDEWLRYWNKQLNYFVKGQED